MSRYCAVIGDLVGSKQLDRARRVEASDQLTALLEQWNDRFDVAAPFVVSRGDEFEGLLHTTTHLPELLWDVAALDDVDVRLGFGIDEVFTDLPAATSDEVDGPAYHRARAAIDAAKASGHRGGDFDGFGPPWDGALGAIARRLYATRRDWTDSQREVAGLLRDGLEQVRIADKLGVTRQNISKHAAAAGWQLHADLDEALATLLAAAWQTTGSAP